MLAENRRELSVGGLDPICGFFYSPRVMAGRFALIFLAALLCCCRLAAVWGANPPQAAEQLILLRNGETLRGRVARQDDHYQITIADGELRIRVADVELICQTLEEAYQARRARLTIGRAEDHLDLADWCLRQGLPGDAARELSSALTLDPTNPRIGLIDRRLQESLAPPPKPSAAPKPAAGPRVTDEDLDRMLRALPPTAIESFTTSIQPLLVSSCATAGCHGSTSKGDFSLIRVPADRFGSRRLTQRNLQSTLLWLDFQNPQQSRLLAVVSSPHGTVRSAVFDPQGSKYHELLIWIGMVTQKPVFEPDIVAQPATVRPANLNPALRGFERTKPTFTNSAENPAASWPSDEIPPTAAADADTRPVRTSHRARPSKPTVPRSDPNDAPQSPATGPAAPPTGPAAPAAQADPYNAEAFNRQFANGKPLPGQVPKAVLPPATPPQK